MPSGTSLTLVSLEKYACRWTMIDFSEPTDSTYTESFDAGSTCYMLVDDQGSFVLVMEIQSMTLKGLQNCDFDM